MTLPRIESLDDDYRPVYADDRVWLPAMRAICRRHGLAASDLRREQLGTHVVFGAGGRILKLFCPLWPEDHVAERAVLRVARGLPVPELVAEGEIDGWPYLVVTRLRGAPANGIWSSLADDEKRPVVEALGELMAELHAHPPVPELALDWNGFLRERIGGLDAHHGVEDPWRTWIRERARGFAEPPFDPVLLCADITADHVLLERRGGAWRISGLIDFGDAMMGHPHYEFVAPLCFFTYGRPALGRALVEAYGLDPSPAVFARLTTYCLLHRYGTIRQFLDRHRAADPREFEQALWGPTSPPAA